MSSSALRLRSSLSFTSIRSYATRLPEKPPYRAPDPLKNNPNAVYQNLPEDLTFIHRPPPTAPSPLSYTTSPASPLLKAASSSPTSPLPPPLRANKSQPPRVSDEDLAEIRRLRREDPVTWTRGKLAQKFNCTPYFVGLVAPAPNKARKEILKKKDGEHEEARSKWGEKKAFFKDAARKRRDFW